MKAIIKADDHNLKIIKPTTTERYAGHFRDYYQLEFRANKNTMKFVDCHDTRGLSVKIMGSYRNIKLVKKTLTLHFLTETRDALLQKIQHHAGLDTTKNSINVTGVRHDHKKYPVKLLFGFRKNGDLQLTLLTNSLNYHIKNYVIVPAAYVEQLSICLTNFK